ncbi:hypothetical protein [Paraburkholderia elongata]|uniref:Uncharacterized protein n=1 Tax=Paraburkholderia elongata TaxID=2675747 RepID=A0A972NYN9_9BURK|nr:hypothetical protein [Paraburkholderia elongata]NPT62256.1 hypothetical protein [Paraburkholderia elongata]
MSKNAIQATATFDEIESLCIHLFDIWCERRSVVPLTYLMQSWPMPTLSSLVVTRLVGGFQDLLRFHAASLAADETELLESVIALVDELRRGPFSDTINHAELLAYAGGEAPAAASTRDMRVSDDSVSFEKLVC